MATQQITNQPTELTVVAGGAHQQQMATRQHSPQVIRPLVPQTIEQAAYLASNFHRAGMFGFKSEAQALTVILTGMDLGITPATAVRSIHVIENKPSLSADLMVSLCKSRKDVCEYFVCLESTSERAVCKTKRIGDPCEVTQAFTKDDAINANLWGKGNWTKHAPRMLVARCKSILARLVYEDLLLGLYTPDELTEGVLDVVDGEIVSAPVGNPVFEPEDPAAARKASFDALVALMEPMDKETRQAWLVYAKDIYEQDKIGAMSKDVLDGLTKAIKNMADRGQSVPFLNLKHLKEDNNAVEAEFKDAAVIEAHFSMVDGASSESAAQEVVDLARVADATPVAAATEPAKPPKPPMTAEESARRKAISGEYVKLCQANFDETVEGVARHNQWLEATIHTTKPNINHIEKVLIPALRAMEAK